VRGVSALRGNLNGRTTVSIAAFTLIFILFLAFFFWSRAVGLAAG
jgi:hypothetical protein